MGQNVTLVIGKNKDAVLSACSSQGVNPGQITWGKYGHGGRCRDVFAAWGITPSPIAFRAVTSVLHLYLGEHTCVPRIFYLCYAGTHTSVIASLMHLGIITLEDVDAHGPNLISVMPYFDRRTGSDIGVPLLLGKDGYGSEVYALGTGWLGHSLELCLCDLVEVARRNARACFCSVRGILDWQARVGGFLSRRLNLVGPGRNLISRSVARKAAALYRATRYCLDLSSKWKDNENHSEGEVVWIDGAMQQRGPGLPD